MAKAENVTASVAAASKKDGLLLHSAEHYSEARGQRIIDGGNWHSGVPRPFVRHLFSWKPSCSCTWFGAAGYCWAGQ